MVGNVAFGRLACRVGTHPRQSGNGIGRAFIRGGRANARQAIYMPALVAIRFNPELKAKYRQLKAAGKAPKVAITAIMRKIVVIANALLRDGRKWEASMA
ncbi:transposase [Rhizobium sp. GN54]|nr:transposase [Rhizobium sp. GN54]MCD2185145.1 transposase [Rhizobium sp. GN54]